MKVLLFDIETAPNLGYTWRKWEQNVIEFKQDWYILCFAAKWLDDPAIITAALPDFPAFKKQPTNDKWVCKALWKLMDEADVCVAHNGMSFDFRKAHARFVIHGLRPPMPYKAVDTKRIAKRFFNFDSNKLDDLGRQLGLGRKLHHGEGFQLWLDCMAGKPKAWETMVAYNKQDVVLLEKVYMKLRGWQTNHPNHNFFDDTKDNCPTCGGHRLQARGVVKTLTSEYKRYYCADCGAWSRGNLFRTYKVERRNPP